METEHSENLCYCGLFMVFEFLLIDLVKGIAQQFRDLTSPHNKVNVHV